MNRKIFLAGATGAIGSRLLPLLVEAGYEVCGTTRLEKKATQLQAAAAEKRLCNESDTGVFHTSLRMNIFSRILRQVLPRSKLCRVG